MNYDQAVGGTLSISANDSKANKAGSRIFLAGLALQLLSFFTFTCIYLTFLYRVHKRQPEIWTMDAGKKWYWDWRALAGALFVSCIGILVCLIVPLRHGMLTGPRRSVQFTVRLNCRKVLEGI